MDKNLIREYDEWIKKDIPVDSSWDEELNYIAYLRERIHDEVLHSSDKEKEAIRKLDEALQAHILSSKQTDFVFSYPRDEESVPKSYWWAWLDQLDQLTEAERKTL